MASSAFSPSLVSLSFNSALPSTTHRPVQALSTSGSSVFGGLRLGNKVQLQMATTRVLSLSGGFATKISCSTAEPETLQIVQSIIAKQLSVDESAVTAQTRFADMGADSLDSAEIMMSLAEKFGISIREGAAENISTVQELADLIENLMKAQS